MGQSLNLLYRNVEAIVADNPGESMEEKIAEAGPDMKRLLISVRLMKSRLDMASIANNPSSAAFGRLRPTPIYKIFHRMARLFELEANQRAVTIRLHGTSFATPALYDSFESIPLVLLDNAIKYASSNSDIEVLIDDRSGRVFVSVTSTGSIVPPGEASQIFDKSFRSEGAKQFTSSGSGLGLYIAQTVANANGFMIGYRSEPSYEDESVGENIFSFAINWGRQ
jgi:signal transduction histidine kinase